MANPGIPDFLRTANVYREMGRHGALLQAWAPLRQHVVKDSALGPERLEIVILRAAHRLQAPYEWAHHILRGRRAGLPDALIAALAGPVAKLSGEAALLAEAVDALSANAALAPDLRQRLTDALGPDGVLDLMATVGFYTTLAFIVKTFDVALDEDVARELAAAPLAPAPRG